MFELYILETCPYSRKVMDYFDENGIEYTKHDVSKQENHDELIELGGKNQVPFLYDPENDISLYESDDIIEYADNNK